MVQIRTYNLQVRICTSIHLRPLHCKFVLFNYHFLLLSTKLYHQGLKAGAEIHSEVSLVGSGVRDLDS